MNSNQRILVKYASIWLSEPEWFHKKSRWTDIVLWAFMCIVLTLQKGWGKRGGSCLQIILVHKANITQTASIGIDGGLLALVLENCMVCWFFCTSLINYINSPNLVLWVNLLHISAWKIKLADPAAILDTPIIVTCQPICAKYTTLHAWESIQ